MSGNPLVRFDEGRVGRTSVSPSLLLYRSAVQHRQTVALRKYGSLQPSVGRWNSAPRFTAGRHAHGILLRPSLKRPFPL